MQAEGKIVNECMIALSQAGCTVWRNDTGAYKADGRLIRYGLCKGSADIVGVAPDGRFLAVECKTATGRTTQEQNRFLTAVRSKGGRAGVARSADQAVLIATGPLAPPDAG